MARQELIAMPFVVTDCQTSASGSVNEDRVGSAHNLAWVIDGATDVVEHPLTGAVTDADWIAGRRDAALAVLAVTPPTDLSQIPDLTATQLATEFARQARLHQSIRPSPSASAIVVRACAFGIDYVSVGDCTLLVESTSGFVRVGVDAADAGDPQLAKALAAVHANHGGLEAETARAQIWPSIKAGRAGMNELYGVFSITATPRHFVQAGQIAMPAGGHALLASDGLMRVQALHGFGTFRGSAQRGTCAPHPIASHGRA
jgi:hypothetical protein